MSRPILSVSGPVDTDKDSIQILNPRSKLVTRKEWAEQEQRTINEIKSLTPYKCKFCKTLDMICLHVEQPDLESDLITKSPQGYEMEDLTDDVIHAQEIDGIIKTEDQINEEIEVYSREVLGLKQSAYMAAHEQYNLDKKEEDRIKEGTARYVDFEKSMYLQLHTTHNIYDEVNKRVITVDEPIHGSLSLSQIGDIWDKYH